MSDDEGRLLARECRCTEEVADAACPDHGLLAYLAAAIAADEARDAEGDETR